MQEERKKNEYCQENCYDTRRTRLGSIVTGESKRMRRIEGREKKK